MSPPNTQSSQGNSRGAYKANNAAFPPAKAFFSTNHSSHPSFGVPMNMHQLQQLQAAQQQATQQQQQHHSQQIAHSGVQPVNSGMSVANQFFVSTSTAPGAAPPVASAQQIQATAMQQVAFASNSNVNVPFLISDPNAFMHMQPLQQEQALQRSSQMTFQPMSPFSTVPNLQIQQQRMIQQFSVFPSHVNAHQAQQQVPSMITHLQQPQLAHTTQHMPNPAVQAQICANVIQQALKDPQYQAAGQVLLQTMQASSSYMKDLMKNQQHQQAPAIPTQPPQKQQVVSSSAHFQPQEVIPKTVESASVDTIMDTAVPKQVYLESSLEPVKREEDEHEADDEDMWEYFFKSDEEKSSHHSDSPPETSFGIKSSVMETNGFELQSALDSIASPVVSSTQSTTQSFLPTLSLQEPATVVKREVSPKLIPSRAECGKVKKTQRRVPPITFEFKGSPQQYLMAILRERGYSTDLIPNAETGYHSEPTPMELASFGTEVVQAVHAGDVAKLKSLLDCGLSPSPCNSFGDYMVHLVCRRADFNILECLVNYGCNLNVCDSFGRTPLHCVAWAGDFCSQSAELILNMNRNQILVQDNRGQCPLEYVRKEQWREWISFLRRVMDTYWPIDGNPQLQPAKEVKREQVPEISLELAKAVASGQISTDVVASMDNSTRKYYQAESLESILFS